MIRPGDLVGRCLVVAVDSDQTSCTVLCGGRIEQLVRVGDDWYNEVEAGIARAARDMRAQGGSPTHVFVPHEVAKQLPKFIGVVEVWGDTAAEEGKACMIDANQWIAAAGPGGLVSPKRNAVAPAMIVRLPQ